MHSANSSSKKKRISHQNLHQGGKDSSCSSGNDEFSFADGQNTNQNSAAFSNSNLSLKLKLENKEKDSPKSKRKTRRGHHAKKKDEDLDMEEEAAEQYPIKPEIEMEMDLNLERGESQEQLEEKQTPTHNDLLSTPLDENTKNKGDRTRFLTNPDYTPSPYKNTRLPSTSQRQSLFTNASVNSAQSRH